MMATRTKAQLPVGSAQWIQDENRQLAQFFTQEAEDFSFSARNEIDWLNEHMAEIFSKNQVNITEIFKTPGKLRGKTPRTNRKRNALEVRQPLTDMFMTNSQPNTSRLHAKTPSKCGPKIHFAAEPIVSTTPKLDKAYTDSGYHGTSEDEMESDNAKTPTSLPAQQEKVDDALSEETLANEPQWPTKLTERERTTEGSFHSANEGAAIMGTPKESPEVVSEVVEAVLAQNLDSAVDGASGPLAAAVTEVPPNDIMDCVEIDNDSVLAGNPSLDASHSSSADSSPAKTILRKSSLTFAALPAREPLTTKKSMGARVSGTTHFDQHRGTIGRGSFLGRYTGGKSLGGARQPDAIKDEPKDEMDVDEPEKLALDPQASNRNSTMLTQDDKSSMQRLRQQMSQVGDGKPSAANKSIPAISTVSQPLYPTLVSSTAQPPQPEHVAALNPATDAPNDNEEDDDWIQAPQVPSNDLQRPKTNLQPSSDDKTPPFRKSSTDGQISGGGHNHNAVTVSSFSQKPLISGLSQGGRELPRLPPEVTPSSPLKVVESDQLKTAGRLAPNIVSTEAAEALPKTLTTPHDTPVTKKNVDGPLSASKSKLQSIMKTARVLFTSSAGVSAQAKMETFSPHSMRTRGQAHGALLAENSDMKPKQSPAKKTLASDAPTYSEAQSLEGKVGPKKPEPITEGRKTRSSAEKDERRKARDQERMNAEAQRGGNVEEQRAPIDQRELVVPSSQKVLHETKEKISSAPGRSTRQSPRRLQNQLEPEKEVGYPQIQSIASENAETVYTTALHSDLIQAQSSIMQKPKDLRRPVKPVKEAPSKSKPQPVAIRVGTLSQRIPLMNPSVPSSLQDALPPPPPPPPPVTRPGHVKKPSNASISSNNLKSSGNSNVGKPKALLAAERKREQDEKELHRKAEQKREIERKRAAQQEELRRQEQAQQQEAERQREKERLAAVPDPKKLAQRQAIEKRRLENGKKEQARHASQQDKSQVALTSRPELGGPRPLSRIHGIHDHGKPANQPAGGATRPSVKRIFEPEMDEEGLGSAHVRIGSSSYQQMDAKRRRTDDEEFLEVVVRPTMLPPKRQSNIRKDAPKQSIFGNRYSTSHPPSHSGYHQSSSLLKTSTLNQTYQQHHQLPNQAVPRTGLPHEMAKYINGKIPFAEAPNPPPKSPLRSRPAGPPPPPVAKSSPQYPNGENIDLAEIPTDSEDEDSGDDKAAKGAMLPEWVQSPALRQQLEIQERYVDADAVFGPARSPHMEEMFKGREHRFRSRTSSANWAGPDRLTEEEIRNDRAGREKVRRQGGWSFDL